MQLGRRKRSGSRSRRRSSSSSINTSSYIISNRKAAKPTDTRHHQHKQQQRQHQYQSQTHFFQKIQKNRQAPLQGGEGCDMQLVGSLLRGLVAEKVHLHSGAQVGVQKVMFTHFHPSRWAAFARAAVSAASDSLFSVCGRFLFGELSVQIVEKRRPHVRFAASYC